jgi:hypothetical protein
MIWVINPRHSKTGRKEVKKERPNYGENNVCNGTPASRLSYRNCPILYGTVYTAYSGGLGAVFFEALWCGTHSQL